MVGRGLRTIDQEEFPGVIKTDCIVMDFGTSVLTHGGIDEKANLDGGETGNQGPEKHCPECKALNPLSAKECQICGYLFGSEDGEGEEKETLEHFHMTEVELMDRSPFRWVNLFGNDSCLAATGFDCFALIAEVDGLSMAIVKRAKSRVRLIAVGTKRQAMAAADDYMRQNESGDTAKKTKRWLNDRPSAKQRESLEKYGVNVSIMDFSWTKYKAACMLNYVWNKQFVDRIVYDIVSDMDETA
jgi:hypothetical protein